MTDPFLDPFHGLVAAALVTAMMFGLLVGVLFVIGVLLP